MAPLPNFQAVWVNWFTFFNCAVVSKKCKSPSKNINPWVSIRFLSSCVCSRVSQSWMDKNPLKQFQWFQWLRATLIYIYICCFCHYLVVASVVLSLVIALCHMDLSTHSLHICSSCFRVICGTHIFIYWRSWFSVPTFTHLGVYISCAKGCEFLPNKRPSIFQMLIFRYIWYVAICCSTLNHCDFCPESKESWAEVKFQALDKIMGSNNPSDDLITTLPPMFTSKQPKTKKTS